MESILGNQNAHAAPPRRPRGLLVLACLALGAIIIVVCVLLASWLYDVFYQDVIEGGPRSRSTSEERLHSPLEGVEFPSNQIVYPNGWPLEYRFPEGMELVEARSGPVMGGGVIGWVMKHRFLGPPLEAVEVLASSLTENSWEVVGPLALDSGGLVLLIERGGGGSGVINIDADPSIPGASVLASTLLVP